MKVKENNAILYTHTLLLVFSAVLSNFQKQWKARHKWHISCSLFFNILKCFHCLCAVQHNTTTIHTYTHDVFVIKMYNVAARWLLLANENTLISLTSYMMLTGFYMFVTLDELSYNNDISRLHGRKGLFVCLWENSFIHSNFLN